MIFANTKLTTVDNSGILLIKCIKILGYKNYGILGSKIIGSVRKINDVLKKKNLKKSMLVFAIIVQIKKNSCKR